MNKESFLTQRIAPADGLWVCTACGKTSTDRYGQEGVHSKAWDESCMLNSVLVKRRDLTPGDKIRPGQVVEIYGDLP